MKRSHSIKLALMGAGAITLTACGQAKEEAAVYESVAQCEAAGLVDAEACAAQFEQAQAVHVDTAPRYAREEDCYTDFGYQRCQRYRGGGSSFFLPFMVGYMLAPRGGSGVFTQTWWWSSPLMPYLIDPNISQSTVPTSLPRSGLPETTPAPNALSRSSTSSLFVATSPGSGVN